MGAPPARAFPRAVAAAARRYRVLFTLAFLSFLRVVVRGRARGGRVGLVALGDVPVLVQG